MCFLIVGLGNPGEKYSKNRHNLGFMVLDYIVNQEKINFENQKYGSLAHKKYSNSDVYFLKPDTFMNESGKAVLFFMKKLSVKKENIIVIYDDLDLPLAKIRIKEESSAAGHNGIKSIEEKLQTQKFSRMKLGIERNYHIGQQAKYVLGNFSGDELAFVQKKMDIIYEAIKTFINDGVSKAMNLYNGK